LISRRILIGCALAAAAVSAVAVPAAVGTAKPSHKTAKVTVNDDYFAPTDLKIKKNSKVKWVWSDLNTNTHNFVLTGKRPKGVKKSDFRSSSGAVQLVFKRKFKVPGKYGFICTFHKGVMNQTLTVKK
jgi:plastocyanin